MLSILAATSCRDKLNKEKSICDHDNIKSHNLPGATSAKKILWFNQQKVLSWIMEEQMTYMYLLKIWYQINTKLELQIPWSLIKLKSSCYKFYISTFLRM